MPVSFVTGESSVVRQEGKRQVMTEEEETYKLSHLDRKRILTAARKALMVADNAYHAWSPDKQERFRATMGKEMRGKIQCVLLGDLFDIKGSIEQLDEARDDMSHANINLLNWATLLTTGIGENYIYLNECMAEGKSLLDFTTLHDYDYADYLFQEGARKRDFPEYKGMNYYAWLHPSWVRLLIQEKFYYSTFTSLATYTLDEVKSAGDELIDKLIPHEYVDGKNHRKREKGGLLWDKKIDAAGQEAQLDELKSRWYAYQRERWLTLSEENVQEPAAVYVHEENWDDDPHRSFIFTNEQTLKQIRWRYFLSDCELLMAEFSVVENLLTEEISRAEIWLTENHRDIQDNFDSTVVKLRKKYKVVMSENALQDLSDIDPTDD